jgi:hypothetical protein
MTSVPSVLALRISRRPPCSCTSALAIDLAERCQRHRDFFAGHAQTRVAHAHRGAAARARTRLDRHRAAGRRELEGVADQVAEHLVQLRRIALYRGQVRIELALERDTDLDGGRPEGGQRHVQDLVEIHLAGIERVLAALHLGHVEDVVDDGEEMGGSIADEVGVFDDLGVHQRPLLVLAQQLGKADHGVERCPELMAHIGDEFGFDLACQRGLDPR